MYIKFKKRQNSSILLDLRVTTTLRGRVVDQKRQAGTLGFWTVGWSVDTRRGFTC